MNARMPIVTDALTQDLHQQMAELCAAAAGSKELFFNDAGSFASRGRLYSLPRFLFRGPDSAHVGVRIGVFAAIHGDEPEAAFATLEFLRRLAEEPERARGYEIYVYPVCNPTGLEDGTRHARSGADLNREFWKGSAEPEVRILERQLSTMAFQGVVALHADDTTEGVYAYVRGATLTEALARPVLKAAEAFLPRAAGEVIDGFPAREALICDACYKGVLSHPAALNPAPFELIFETPQESPFELQVRASVAALESVLSEYRPFLAFGQNL